MPPAWPSVSVTPFLGHVRVPVPTATWVRCADSDTANGESGCWVRRMSQAAAAQAPGDLPSQSSLISSETRVGVLSLLTSKGARRGEVASQAISH